MANDKDNIHFLVSYDEDDSEMKPQIIERLSKSIPITFVCGKSDNKIHACNRDIEQVQDWDIVLLLSDDMIPQKWGWDDSVRQAYSKDLDLCVHFSDGYTKQKLQTLLIYGRPYFDRFGYLYNPEYVSLWSDNESMQVAKLLGKYVYYDEVLFRHEHYSNNQSLQADELMRKNESYYKQDQRTYNKRLSINFGL